MIRSIGCRCFAIQASLELAAALQFYEWILAVNEQKKLLLAILNQKVHNSAMLNYEPKGSKMNGEEFYI